LARISPAPLALGDHLALVSPEPIADGLNTVEHPPPDTDRIRPGALLLPPFKRPHASAKFLGQSFAVYVITQKIVHPTNPFSSGLPEKQKCRQTQVDFLVVDGIADQVAIGD